MRRIQHLQIANNMAERTSAYLQPMFIIKQALGNIYIQTNRHQCRCLFSVKLLQKLLKMLQLNRVEWNGKKLITTTQTHRNYFNMSISQAAATTVCLIYQPHWVVEIGLVRSLAVVSIGTSLFRRQDDYISPMSAPQLACELLVRQVQTLMASDIRLPTHPRELTPKLWGKA